MYTKERLQQTFKIPNNNNIEVGFKRILPNFAGQKGEQDIIQDTFVEKLSHIIGSQVCVFLQTPPTQPIDIVNVRLRYT